MAKIKSLKKTGKFQGIFSFILCIFPIIWKFLAKNKRWFIIPIGIIAIKIFAPSTFFILSFACLFYLIFFPAITWLQSIFQSNRLSVAIFILVLFSLIIFSFAFIIPALVNQIIEFTKNYPQIQDTVIKKLELVQDNFRDIQKTFLTVSKVSIDDIISKYLNQWGQAMITFLDGIIQSLSQILTSVFHVLVAFIVSLYLLFQRKAIFSMFQKYFEHEATKKEKKFFSIAYQQIVAYFSGLMFLSLIGFFATWIFLSIIGVKFSLLLAIWTGIMEFIPIFGPIIAIIPIAIVAWTQSANLVLYIITFFLILQFILGYLLAPQVLGKKIQFPPILVFIILLIGAETYGILGMIFAIPIVSLVVLFWQVYTEAI
ncbi:MAG: AI-2E family transporter [Candidatus Margulisbacteria bacterium]|nr:AI-2E family transporter [Candidatus Margulisiibacteriota bacterium]